MINISPPNSEEYQAIVSNLDTATTYQLQQSTEEILAEKISEEALAHTLQALKELAMQNYTMACLFNERLRRLEP